MQLRLVRLDVRMQAPDVSVASNEPDLVISLALSFELRDARGAQVVALPLAGVDAAPRR